MNKFPSIESVKNVISYVRQHYKYEDIPSFKFRGTVKLHGTHADVVLNADGSIHYQSRNNIITIEKDNVGFAAFASQIDFKYLFDLIQDTTKQIDPNRSVNSIMISGEYCGGNIQKGVALCKLPKMFVIYGIKIGDKYASDWVNIDQYRNVKLENKQIYHILDFQHWIMDIDFNINSENLVKAKESLEKITDEVSKECPVGKHFGVSGIGEGVVWQCIGINGAEDKYNLVLNKDMTFKVKGDEHQVVRAPKAEIDMQLVSDINEMCDFVVTNARLAQGIEYLKEQHIALDNKATGVYVKWINSDVMKEEADRIKASGFVDNKLKMLIKSINKKALQYYNNYITSIEISAIN